MKGLTFLGGLTAIVIALVLGSILNGWVLSTLWGWFVVPIFGLPVLPIAAAIGISLTVKYMTHQISPDCEEKKREAAEQIGRLVGVTVLYPLLAVFIGWIVQKFM